MENNTKRNFKDIGLDGVDWIPLTQENDRWQAFMNTVKKPFRFCKTLRIVEHPTDC